MNTKRIEDRSIHARRFSIFFVDEILYCLILGWTLTGS